MSDDTPDIGYRRIATEEAYAPPDMLDRYRALIKDHASFDPGFESLMGYFLFNGSDWTRAVIERLEDLGERRLADMDDAGIDHQVIALTAPGIQIFDADTATGLATDYNDQLAEAIAGHPDRFSALAAVAPQHPSAAAAELERAVKTLGLKGAIVNSHTRGEYLDDAKFWDNYHTTRTVQKIFPMFPLSVDGIGEAVQALVGARR